MAFYTPQPNLENNQLPLLQPTQTPLPEPEFTPQKHVKRFIILITFSCMLVILSLMALIFSLSSENTSSLPCTVVPQTVKTQGLSFNWTEDMLLWQKTGYHLQAKIKWMSDPDGPLFHKGYYHLFYQRNTETVLWGTMLWAHVVSTDLIHWKDLPFAIVPDQWYETHGSWGGSATILPNGNILMLYTGETKEPQAQVQNLAYPANLSDPLLLEWVKYPGNPILTPPNTIDPMDFRDPTTAWVDHNGVWRIIIGTKNGTTGVSLVYKTEDFKTFEFEGNFHQVQGTGIWECLDFYPVSTKGDNGLDNSAYESGMKHLFKASLEDIQEDYYALGTYDMEANKWTPDNPEMDVGIGLRLDYGKFYASKSFFDPHKKRRILWGMVKETDTEADDVLRDWVHMQAIPRVVTYDTKTGSNILLWPVEELESLRKDYKEYHNLLLHPGSIIDLNITSAEQLDISVEFVINQGALKSAVEDEVINNCKPAYVRQALGPFGIVVLADESLSELTPIYFYIAKASDGTVKKWFCTDQSRSSKACGVDKKVHGGPIPVLEGENYNIRILVDHSIVEAFGQGGRTCVTSRLYPTRAINGNTRVFLFNNATKSSVTASINIWKMDSCGYL